MNDGFGSDESFREAPPMNSYASFLELWLAPGQLNVRLGSGLHLEVVDLLPPRPSIVLMMREPRDTAAGITVRAGVAELGPEGPEPVFGDVYEQRGAWGRLFTQGMSAAKKLCNLELPVDNPTWLEVVDGQFQQVDAGLALAALGPTQAPEAERLFIQVRMTQLQFNEALRLLNEPYEEMDSPI